MLNKTNTQNPKPLTLNEAYKIVGEKKELLRDLANFIHKNYLLSEKFEYSKKSGWTIFFRKSGKSLCYINLKKEGFVVTVVIGAGLSEEIKKVKVSKKVTGLFEKAYQYHDGRWLNLYVESKEDIEDIKKLILIKKKPTHL